MEEEYRGELKPAIIYIPSNAFKVVITANVIDKETDSIATFQNTMGLDEIIDARIDGDDYEFKNGNYVITDRGKELLRNG